MQTAHAGQTGQPKVHLHLEPNENLSLALLFNANPVAEAYSIYFQRQTQYSTNDFHLLAYLSSLFLPVKPTVSVLAGISRP